MSATLKCLFDGHFTGQCGYAGTRIWDFIAARMMVVVTTGAVRCMVKPSHPTFHVPDMLPVTQLTMSEHRRKRHNPRTFSPHALWGSSISVVTTKCSWLPWGRVAKSLISPLMPVPSNNGANETQTETQQHVCSYVCTVCMVV